MASKDKIVREEQLKRFEEKLSKRIGLLKEKGKTEREIGKDSIVRKLKASLKDARKRLQTIARKQEQIENLKKMKAEKALIPKAERKLQKKTASEPEAPKKEKKSKKKKEVTEEPKKESEE